MIKINLFPLKEIKREKAIRKIIIVNGLLFLLIVMFSGFIYFDNVEKIDNLDKSIKREKQKLTKLASLRKKIKEFKEKQKILETKLKIINDLNSFRLYPSYIFYLLSQKIPKEVWINYLNVTQNKISIKGIALDEPTIVKFINRLKETNFFKNIYLNQINQRNINKFPLKEFSIDLYPDLIKFKEML